MLSLLKRCKHISQTFPAHRNIYSLEERVQTKYLDRIRSWNNQNIIQGQRPGKDAVVMQDNDYLCIAQHPKIVEAKINSLKREGNDIHMSAVCLQDDSIHRKFELSMAEYLGVQDTLLCQSGYAANIGLIEAIAGPKTPIYIDKNAHMSLWKGVQSSGAEIVPFKHNSVHHLTYLLQKYGKGVIVIDSVNSTNGNIGALDKIISIGKKSSCVIVVDESHSLGLFGPNGSSMLSQLGLTQDVHFITASLAKAFAGRGGLIACPVSGHREFLTLSSMPAIFSTAVPTHDVAGFQAALDIIKNSDSQRRQLHQTAEYMRENLQELGFYLAGSEAQIISLVAGSEQNTLLLRDALEARGIFGSVFAYPATPVNGALIRYTVNTNIGKSKVDRMLEACREVKQELDMRNWPLLETTNDCKDVV